MKTIYLFLLASILIGCNKPKETVVVKAKTPTQKAISKDSIMPAKTDTIVLKDINNDNISDTAFVYTPPTLASFDDKGNIEYEMGCVDNKCFNKITFSCKLPEIVFEESVWGKLENAGDLNGDGISELLFAPDWFTSSLGHLYLYSFSNGKWEIVTSIKHRRDDEPILPNLIKSKGKYYLHGVDFYNDDEPYQIEIKFKK